MAFGHLLSAIGLAALKAEARAMARRAGIRAATGVATGIFLFIAIGFGVAAFTVWLAREIGTIEALLVVAGIMVVLALIVQLIARLALSRRRRPVLSPQAQSSSGTKADSPPSSESPPPGSELGSIAVVALVGFLLARQMFRRR